MNCIESHGKLPLMSPKLGHALHSFLIDSELQMILRKDHARELLSCVLGREKTEQGERDPWTSGAEMRPRDSRRSLRSTLTLSIRSTIHSISYYGVFKTFEPCRNWIEFHK